MKQTVTRLFESFKPENYTLTFDLDPEKSTFSGTVVIKGQKTGRPSQRLTFHQKDLTITAASAVKHGKKGDEVIKFDRINTQKSFDELRLHSKAMLYPGAYTITVEFNGAITDHMQGIYPCYFEAGGKKQKLIATQFESHHAREAFPCIDEPEAKATFDLSLITHKDYVVLSNMPSQHEETIKTVKTTIFDTTPIMSTYLLAFVAGNMHCVEAKTKHGVIVRSWSSVAQPKDSLQYSVEEGVRVLEFFSNYFQIPYPLPKCDQVALPDFDAGAMENWGLITYREIALLADPHNRSVSNEQYVSLVIAHELSHQWFGNLVTMKWWDDLWLNESFASLMEHIALDAIHPDWQQWEFYASSDVLNTSSRDVYSDIQPVSVEIVDPELIEALFDPGIVYAKGGRLLKMLRDYIGDEAFRKGLRSYFTKHAYQNATRNDLWTALGASSKQDLHALMNPWIIRPGMPVVSVAQDGTTVKLAQERFLLDAEADGTIWPIPLLTDDQIEEKLFESKEQTLTLKKDSFVLLNQHASGHYFVNYLQPEHRSYLQKAIKERVISTEARINMLNDMYMLSRHSDASLADALQAAAVLQEEPRDSVWVMIARIVGAASQLTEGSDSAEERLKTLRINVAKHWFTSLGWDDAKNDDANTKQLRHTALALTLSGEDPEAITEALKRYAHAKNIQDLPAEIRNSILSTAVRHGKPTVIDHLLKEYVSTSPDVQLDITSALSSTKDPKVAKHIFSIALGKNGFVRSQDVLRWIAMFLRNRYTREVTWQFMIQEWKWLEDALSKSKSFDYLPTYCAGVITTEEWAKKYHDFFEPLKRIKMLERNIMVGYSDIDARVAWRKRDEPQIQNWLNNIYQ